MPHSLGRHLALVGILTCTALAGAQTRIVQSLDANWRFSLTPESTTPAPNVVGSWNWRPLPDKIDTDAATLNALVGGVPAPEWQTAHSGDDVFHGRIGFALFETTLTPDAGKKLLHFESVDDNATVYLNGRRVVHHEGWNDPFDVSLKSIPPGQPIVIDVVDENIDGPGGIGPVSFAQDDTVSASPQAQPKFDDSSWRIVQVPHDFVIEGKFNQAVDANHAALPRGKAWYRRSIDLPRSARGKDVWVDFEGAFADAHVWWNGHYLGSHRSGYTGFRFDLSRFAHFGGKNELSVHLDAGKTEGWWYEGGGIYRHVWLTIANPVHIAPLGGVYITTNVPNPLAAHPKASITIQTRLEGLSKGPVKVIQKLFRPDGRLAGTGSSQLEYPYIQSSLTLRDLNASLWSLQHPALYSLRTELSIRGRIVDSVETPFGVRTIRFDANRGFFLNGRPVKLQGTCNHQDFAGVGIGMPDSVLEWRVRKLQSIGCNAYRCSHNEVAPELLDYCDRLGMLVMDENREFGDSRSGKANEHTTTNDLSDFTQEILRDRNHPSVIMWSLCNEEFAVQTTPAGGRIATIMGALAHQLDPTRPVTAALNGGHGHSMSAALDLEGFNYGPWEYPSYHAKHPHQPIFASETASTLTTRGEYANDKSRGMVQAYDREGSDTAENAWQPVAEEPYNAGAFVWTGFDYKGEPTPYSWPNISSNFGILDSCGFLKDNAFYYKAWWGTQPIVHIEPHWNWPGKEGQPINVWVFGNGDTVELFLNGESLGKKPMPKYRHIEWSVPYAPGALVARSYVNGKLTATDRVETTGSPAALKVTTLKSTIPANGEECSMLEVSVVDAAGRTVPSASNVIRFSASGPARIVGVGNGDPTSHEPDRASVRHAFHGLCLGIAQASNRPGTVLVSVSSPGLRSASIRLNVQSER
jgi:beta-galactosidase